MHVRKKTKKLTWEISLWSSGETHLDKYLVKATKYFCCLMFAWPQASSFWNKDLVQPGLLMKESSRIISVIVALKYGPSKTQKSDWGNRMLLEPKIWIFLALILGLNSQQRVWNHAFLLTCPRPQGGFVGAALCCGWFSSATGTGILVRVEQTRNLSKIFTKNCSRRLGSQRSPWDRTVSTQQRQQERQLGKSTSVNVHKWTSHTHTVIAPKLYIMCLK